MPEPRLIDSDVLDALRSGRPSALATVYEVYGAMVYRVALAFVERGEDAEDVLQDVFVGLPETLGSLESAEAFGRWLKRVAVRTAFTHRRAAERRRRLARDHELLSEHVVEYPPDRLDLERAIASLPEKLRLVFVLREVQGFSHMEVAASLGISRHASQQRLHRARARLRRLLGGQA